MLNSEVLEVGIGLAFLFMLMSLICASLKEALEGLLKWRAMDLERALRTMFDDDKGELVKHLYEHPLISSLYQGRYQSSRLVLGWLGRVMPGLATDRRMALAARRNLPSYIPSAQFSAALMDLVGRGPITADGEGAPQAPLTVPLLRERAAALASPFLRRVLLSAIDRCDGDLHKLQDNLQRWFDGSMDRASGWYKRRTQTVLFGIGLLAAVLLNVDALHVMSRLTADRAFREIVVEAAAKAELPVDPASGDATRPLEMARKAREALNDVGMPIGWTDWSAPWYDNLPTPVQRDCGTQVPADRCDAAQYSVLRLLVGWLVTAFAVMLGAPFWFDVLNKLMVIRSTVKPREKSREEGSEDRVDARPDAAASETRPAPSEAVMPPAAADGAPPPRPPEPFVPHTWRDGMVNPQEVKL